jgi:hypothetical protein
VVIPNKSCSFLRPALLSGSVVEDFPYESVVAMPRRRPMYKDILEIGVASYGSSSTRIISSLLAKAIGTRPPCWPQHLVHNTMED